MCGSHNRKIKIFVCLIICGFILSNCTATKADGSQFFALANISWHDQYNEIVSKLGEIWIGYTRSTSNIITDSGAERFIMGMVNFYYKRGDNFILMGSVDEIGVHDKNGVLLKAVPNVTTGFQIAGISSLIKDSALGINFILRSITDVNHYRETELWVFINIDIDNATIELVDMRRFFSP